MSPGRDGFKVADLDTAIANDPKVKALVRRHPEQADKALLLYILTYAESWGGSRITVDDGQPWWWLTDGPGEYAEALIEVGLIERDTRKVPDSTWIAMYGPAVERLLRIERTNIYGGLRRQGMTPAEANAEADIRIALRREERLADLRGSALEVEPTRPAFSSVLPSDRPTDRPEEDEEDELERESGAPALGGGSPSPTNGVEKPVVPPGSSVPEPRVEALLRRFRTPEELQERQRLAEAQLRNVVLLPDPTPPTKETS